MCLDSHDLFHWNMEVDQVLAQLRKDPATYRRFLGLTENLQEELIAFCMGSRGLVITYDPFFKAIFNPEIYSGRLARMLSAILGDQIIVKRALPTDSNRLVSDGSLLIMDILVELSDGSLADIEMQKVGYTFPGERGACYSSDLVLRQYARVRETQKEGFTYRDMKKVFTIVLMEKSTSEFQKKKEHYIHHSRQVFNTGLELNLLQEYIYISLDVFLDNYRKNPQTIDRELDAWLLFLISDSPSDISRLIEWHPWMKELYADIFEFRRHPKELVNMYSKALEIMDRNTVRYMVEEQKAELERQEKELTEKELILKKQADEISELKRKLAELSNGSSVNA